MANTNSNSWDEGAPVLSDPRRLGATEIQSLRTGVNLRISREHVALAAGGVGGEHKPGSTKCYLATTAPTTRPDGITPLDSNDVGRLWINTTTGIANFWNGTAWTTLNAPTGLESFHKDFAQPVAIPDFQAGLTPNKRYHVVLVGTTVAFRGSGDTYTVSVTLNSQTRTIIIDNHPDGSAPFVMTFLVNATNDGKINLNAASEISRIMFMTGVRLT